MRLTISEFRNLVELKGVEEVEEFSVLLVFLDFDVVLLETVEGEFGLVVNEDLHWLQNPCEFGLRKWIKSHDA